jgi:membrane protein
MARRPAPGARDQNRPAALKARNGARHVARRGKRIISVPPRRLLDIASLAALALFGLSLAGAAPAIPAPPRPAPLIPQARATPAPRGPWPIARTVLARFNRDRIMAEAAGVTFYALLAIFPAIASLISLYGLIADPATIGAHLSLAAGVIPEGGMQIITGQVASLTASPHQALGWGAVIGILTSLWSANAGIKSLFDALNVVYEKRETRGFIGLTLTSLAFTLGALAFIILALGAVVALPAILGFVGLSAVADMSLSLARWPLMLLAMTLMLAFLYRFGPSQAVARWRLLSWGSAFASVTWIGASAGFSWYVANFGSYNKTYGSLGAAVGFMTWIWISTMIVLLGAELDAALAQGTAPRAA